MWSVTMHVLGVARGILSAAIYIVDSSISGFGLTALAQAWAGASAAEQKNLLHDTVLLPRIMRGTRANVLNFFSGLSFALSRLAVALSLRYPTWFGRVAVAGGVGSLAAGITMFLDFGIVSGWLSIAFAIVVSPWLLAVGVLMWRCAVQHVWTSYQTGCACLTVCVRSGTCPRSVIT